MKKIIFIDVDGTLLNDKKELTKTTVDEVRRVRERGYEVVVCTGRAINRSMPVVSELGCNYLIYANGGGIFDCRSGEIIYENPIGSESLKEITGIASRIGAELILLHDTRRYYTDLKGRPQIYAAEGDKEVSGSVEEFVTTRTKVVQVCIIAEVHALRNMLADIKAIQGIEIASQHRAVADLGYDDGHTPYIDIVNETASKGSGIVEFCRRFDIPAEDTIGIGDDLNDMSMIKVCGVGVAMGNALPEVKEIANVVIGDNNHNGVAEFLKTLD